MYFVWILIWLLCLVGSFASGLGILYTSAAAVDDEDWKMALACLGFVFLTVILGWGAWVAAYMS